MRCVKTATGSTYCSVAIAISGSVRNVDAIVCERFKVHYPKIHTVLEKCGNPQTTLRIKPLNINSLVCIIPFPFPFPFSRLLSFISHLSSIMNHLPFPLLSPFHTPPGPASGFS